MANLVSTVQKIQLDSLNQPEILCKAVCTDLEVILKWAYLENNRWLWTAVYRGYQGGVATYCSLSVPS